METTLDCRQQEMAVLLTIVVDDVVYQVPNVNSRVVEVGGGSIWFQPERSHRAFDIEHIAKVREPPSKACARL